MIGFHYLKLSNNDEEMETKQEFIGEYDETGVYVYQAYSNEIADYSIENQKLGGPTFNKERMTWIKPSFAWVLYRSGYATKHNQERILKIKIPHKSLADLLSNCVCKDHTSGTLGRVQWDPARDLFTADGNEPRKLLNKRAIQIGLKEILSENYVNSIISIEDVTKLAHEVGIAHGVLEYKRGIIGKRKPIKNTPITGDLLHKLPKETIYLPQCDKLTLENLGLLPGLTANKVSKLGKGKFELSLS